MVENVLAYMDAIHEHGDMDAQAVLIVEHIALHRRMARKDIGKRAGHGLALGFDGAVGCDVAQMRGEVDPGHYARMVPKAAGATQAREPLQRRRAPPRIALSAQI